MTLTFLCIKIFFARILDVSLGTIRTIVMVKGKTWVSGIIAFFEVFIWFYIAREALNTTIDSLWIGISYAGGYASGTIIGTFLSNHLINGIVGVQVISKSITKKEIELIRNHGYGVSVMDLKDDYEGIKKQMLYIQINNKSLKKLTKLIRSLDESAFIIVNDTKLIQNGYLK